MERLYRSRSNRVIAGVAGGLGEYLQIDPVIIRVIWILLFFAGGSGLLLYIIGWILIPERPVTVRGRRPFHQPSGSQKPGSQSPAATGGESGSQSPGAAGRESASKSPAAAQSVSQSPAAAGQENEGSLPDGEADGNKWPQKSRPESESWAESEDWTESWPEAESSGERAKEGVENRRRLLGGILVVVGFVFLVEQLAPWFEAEWIWPVGLIVVGVALLLRRNDRNEKE